MKWERTEQEPIDYGARDDIEIIKASLIPGRVYALRFKEITGTSAGIRGGHVHKTVIKKYRLVKMYENFALMENRNGIKESFLYWDLWKQMQYGRQAERKGA